VRINLCGFHIHKFKLNIHTQSNGHFNLLTWSNSDIILCVHTSSSDLVLLYALLCQGLQPEICKQCCSQQTSQSLSRFENCMPALSGYLKGQRDWGINSGCYNTFNTQATITGECQLLSFRGVTYSFQVHLSAKCSTETNMGSASGIMDVDMKELQEEPMVSDSS